MKIVVHIAARGEWRALLTYLADLPPVTAIPVGEYTLYRLPAPHPSIDIVLMRGGVGKINAAASAQYALLTWRPSLYIVLGTAGAVDQGLAELDLILATRTIVHDLNPHLAPNDNTLVVDHTVDLPALWDRCVFPFPVRRGVITSGDLDVTRDNVERLRTQYNATIADWESGAVAKVCAMNGTACLILRGVTDTPTSAPADQFQRYRQNTPEVMARLWQTMLVCVEHYLIEDRG